MKKILKGKEENNQHKLRKAVSISNQPNSIINGIPDCSDFLSANTYEFFITVHTVQLPHITRCEITPFWLIFGSSGHIVRRDKAVFLQLHNKYSTRTVAHIKMFFKQNL